MSTKIPNKITIKGARVGFGVTLVDQNGGTPGNVYKYYFEPELEFEVPATATAEELPALLEEVAAEVTKMVQNAVRQKVKADKAERDSRRTNPS